MLIKLYKKHLDAVIVFNDGTLPSETLSALDTPIEKRDNERATVCAVGTLFFGFAGFLFTIAGFSEDNGHGSWLGWMGVAMLAIGGILIVPKLVMARHSRKFERARKATENNRRAAATIDVRSATSNSYALNKLLDTPFGEHLLRIMRDEINEKAIGLNEQIASFTEYVNTNPDGRPFPKIMPHFYAFLSATAELDQLIKKTKASASDSLREQYEAKVNELVNEFSNLMQEVTDGHETQVGYELQKSIEAASSHIYDHFGKIAIPAIA